MTNLILALNPVEEARISAAAKLEGLAPESVRRIVHDRLEPVEAGDIETDPLVALFAQWDQEDSEMTTEEVELENQSWNELKAEVNAIRILSGARPAF